MPSGITIAGSFTRRPGVYTEVDYSANAGDSAAAKRLAIVGDLPFLPKAEPRLVTSQRAMLALSPNDPELKRIASITYRPGSDDRIGANGPSEVVLVSAAKSTQAKGWLKGSDGQDAIQIGSRVWGVQGNGRAVSVRNTGATLFDLSVYAGGKAVEAFRVRLSEVLTCSATRAGEVFASNSRSNGFLVSWHLPVLTEGSNTIDEVCNGQLTLTNSIAPAGGESLTVTVEGVNAFTGEPLIETLNWSNADGITPKTTAGTWSYISGISVTETASPGVNPTFTASVKLIQVGADEASTIGELVGLLAGAGIDASCPSIAASRPFSDLDTFAAHDIADSVLTARDSLAAFTRAIDQSAYVNVLQVASDAAAISGDGGVVCVGGAWSAGDAQDYRDALASLSLQWGVRVIACLSDAATARADLAAHCDYMWGPGRHECQGWVGMPAQSQLSAITAAAQALNSFKVSLVCQEAQITTLAGTPERVAPRYYALMHAAAQCAMGTAIPLTHKRLNVTAVYDGPDWSVRDNVEELLANGLTVTARGVQGLEVERGLSTWLSNNDDARTAVSAVEGVGRFIIRVRTKLDQPIGDPARPSTAGVIQSIVAAEANQAVAEGDGISAWDTKAGVSVTQMGGRWVVGISVAPLYEVTFIQFGVSVLPTSFEV